MRQRDLLPLLVVLLVLLRPFARMNAETPPSRLVSEAIDETRLITLDGNVHPLAQPRYDRGAVPDALPAQRILLLLNRPAAREAALAQFLRDVHTRGSTIYHRWITPEQFGRQFGPADEDIETAVSWLEAKGFSVGRISKSKQFIEFSGLAGQLRDAFHSEIHEYQVKGERHYANASEISIPAALVPLVRGVSPLNNFRAQPYLKVVGRALYWRGTRRATPLFTIPNPYGTPNPYAYPVAPQDFATEYDLVPLYQAGNHGAGQTIGIINESNIDLSLVSAYQNLFGLANNPPQIVIDGDDPGTGGAATEAYLDVEVSGAVAPNATVNLYISNGSGLQDPINLAALRAVEDNQASVLSVSFGGCEQALGNAGNQFWSGLWEQAAAQGQTVLVAAGDTGPECFLGAGLSVSGVASTPWNVAVGGTDFFYADYATGGGSAATLWNQTNSANLGSLKARLPEQVWNDPFGLDVIANGLERSEISSGGGGASSCTRLSSSTGDCASGYPKPSWQAGPGVPPDGVRDLPDVSLFASNGANLSAYAICAFEGECSPGSDSAAEILLAGGTSASSPAMAGIMALINEKYGRQGQANFILYPLAEQQPAAFHDITLGSNDSVCGTGTTDCVVNANGDNVTTVYSAAPGYDLAGGLGSVDATVLLNDWSSIRFLPTTTTLNLASTKIMHGTPITVTAKVVPASGSGTPTGGVAILTSPSLPASQSESVLTLKNGTATGSIDSFPGGYYNVTATYHGDPVFGDSTSPPVALTVTPENSNINFAFVDGSNVVAGGGTVQYDDQLSLNIQPTGVSASLAKPDGKATGTATFRVDSTTATVALNAAGVASWTPPALAIGKHTASASYAGDPSLNSSSASPITFSVAKGVPWLNDNIDAAISTMGPFYNLNIEGNLTVTIEVGPSFGPLTGSLAALDTATPTGTVTVCLGGNLNGAACLTPSYSHTATLITASGIHALYSTAAVTFTNLAAGQYHVSALYSGDANWQTHGLIDTSFVNVSSLTPLAPSTTTLSITPGAISAAGLAALTTTVSGKGVAPTGLVNYYDNGILLTYGVLTLASSGASSSFSFQLGSSSFWNSGANQITAIYLGDSHYQSSTSNLVNLTVTQNAGDFSLAPQLPQITLNSASSGNVVLNLASLNNFNGEVALTCTPSSSQIGCRVNPSQVKVNGAATATLAVTSTANQASAQVTAASALRRNSRLGWFSIGGTFLLASVVLAGFTDGKRRLARLVSFAILAGLFTGAGCGGGANQIVQQPSPPPPPNASTYSVLVTGTVNGIIHNAKITVLVE
jgi:hypothetical protein